MKATTQPVFKDLVLIGGGHTHAIALRMFGMKPLPGVRLTLITEASATAYSGMLPGHVAGFYRHEECHIDLCSLADFAGAQLYLDRAIALDLNTQQVFCATRPPVAYDVLSIDIGSTPQLPNLLGCLDNITPAKPVRNFLRQWNAVVSRVAQSPETPVCLSIVGGGAGGVELALNMQHHVQHVLKIADQPLTNLRMHLLHRGSELMPQHSQWVRDRLHTLLTQRGIHLHLNEEVQEVQPHLIRCQSGLAIPCDEIFWVTQASAPDWLGKSGLAVDKNGFILVADTLQSTSHTNVFAAGDVATMVNYPRPKAGIFAVRQGKPLFHNLRYALLRQPLKPFRPQKNYLSLIGTGNGEAVASWGTLGWRSPLLWTWKNWLDRRFMKRFSDLPEMGRHGDTETQSILNLQSPISNLQSPIMRCAGCGSKVGSTVLERVLYRIQPEQNEGQRLETISPISSTSPSPCPLIPLSSPLPTPHSPKILIGLNTPDDAAVIQVPPDNVLVQTIDYFTSLINDPFIFGQISANHALSDLFAMGAVPHSALAIATIPYATETKVEETLYQLLSGAMKTLKQANVALIGGHTTEGADLAFGLSCNGLAEERHLLRKGGMQPGQVLILTKALGTGTLFAAKMRLQAKGSWIDSAVESMVQSNQRAAECFLKHGATACTDITGFGLLGHLLEMVTASQVAVELNLDAIPILNGAQETVQMGIVSSLQPQNLQASQFIDNWVAVSHLPKFPLLFDPQTSGGLLASVPADQANHCLVALKKVGYVRSTVVGSALLKMESVQPITIKR